MKLRPIPVDPRVRDRLPAGAEAFEAKANGHKYGVLRTAVEIAPGDERVQITVAPRRAGPTPAPWRVIVAACHELEPERDFAIGIPQRRHWLNLDDAQATIFATEVKDEALIASWQRNGRGDEPT